MDDVTSHTHIHTHTHTHTYTHTNQKFNVHVLRWDNTPMDDAMKYGHQKIATYLKKKGSQRGADIMNRS